MTTSYNVGAMLKARAAEHPDRIALIMAGPRDRSGPTWVKQTYAEFDRRSDRYAAGLRARGVKRGDRTLLLVKPTPDFYAFFFGLMKLGAVPVLVDPGMGLKNVFACIEQIKPRVLAAIPPIHVIRWLRPRPFATVETSITFSPRWWLPTGETSEAFLGPDAPFEMEHFGPDDEVGIVFTSGSTGTPKGVTYTHGVFHGVATLAGERLGRVPGRTYLETFAAYVLFDIAQGMTSVVPDMDMSKPAKVDPERLMEAIRAFSPEGAFMSPVVLRKLFAYARDKASAGPAFSLAGLRDVLTGVAPIPGSLHRDLRALAPKATLQVCYGSTEGMTTTHIGSDAVLGETWAETEKGAGNCVGTAFDGMTVRVIKLTDQPIPEWSDEWLVPTGEIGEIVIEGPATSPEYKDRPDANAAAKIRRGGAVLHRMGDLGYLDANGRLWFCGRKSHRLDTAEGVLPSGPPEGVFDAHPKVFRTALVGVGARGAEVPVLCVEMRPGEALTPEVERQILALANGTRWAGRVRNVLGHPSFPVDARHNSKIKREELKTWATAQLGTKRLAAA